MAGRKTPSAQQNGTGRNRDSAVNDSIRTYQMPRNKPSTRRQTPKAVRFSPTFGDYSPTYGSMAMNRARLIARATAC